MFRKLARKHALAEILSDKELAKLGDVYINFAYSLAVSEREGKPTNVRVPSSVMAEALKRTGLREYLPRRISRHDQGDAVEALMIYSWLRGIVSLEECVGILSEKADSPVEAFVSLVEVVKERLKDR